MANRSPNSILISALLNPACYPYPVKTVRLLETHISWLLLAGRYAYKIKKPVDFGFLDFTELSMRHFYCTEEIRLNRRLAPRLYLDVVAIGGSPAQPVFGLEPAFEYAVRMRRFAADKLLDYQSTHEKLTSQQFDSLAVTVHAFHRNLPAASDSGFGNAEAIALPLRENFQTLFESLPSTENDYLSALQTACNSEFDRCLPLFEQRRQAGWVRECHGDLHLGNIVLLRGVPTPFDAIEFNANLRWIDVFNDIAFLIMDLQHRQRPDLAFRFLNAYLQIGGDYAGLSVLRYYQTYRALVRAKVAALRSRQADSETALTESYRYLALADNLLKRKSPALLITHGLPGCGKTAVSQIILEKLQAIRIRSDVERKRLFGFEAHQISGSDIDGGIYSREATELTYRHLLNLTRQLLENGYPVIVDAAFLKQSEREQFRSLAGDLAVPFAIVSVSSDNAIQRQRIRQRQLQNADASEADIAVLEKLRVAAEPLQATEQERVVEVTNNGSLDDIAGNQSLWERLEQLRISADADKR